MLPFTIVQAAQLVPRPSRLQSSSAFVVLKERLQLVEDAVPCALQSSSYGEPSSSFQQSHCWVYLYPKHTLLPVVPGHEV